MEKFELISKSQSEAYANWAINEAGKVFYDLERKSSVLHDCGVISELDSQFGLLCRTPDVKAFADVTGGTSPGLFGLVLTKELKEGWLLGSGIRFKVGGTSFEASFDDGRYHWKTQVTTACLHIKRASSTAGAAVFGNRWIWLIAGEVHWSYLIDEERPEFSDPRVDGVEPAGPEFKQAHVLDLLEYDLLALTRKEGSSEDELKDRIVGEGKAET